MIMTEITINAMFDPVIPSVIIKLSAIAIIKLITAKMASNFIIRDVFDFFPAISIPSKRYSINRLDNQVNTAK